MLNPRVPNGRSFVAVALALLVVAPVAGCRQAPPAGSPSRTARPATGPAYRIVKVDKRQVHYNLPLATWDPNERKTTARRQKAVYDVMWISTDPYGPFGSFTLDAGLGWEARAHATIRAAIRAAATAKADANTLRDRLETTGRQP